MARELELKLEIDPADVGKLRSLRLFAGEHRVERQISVYFDTPKGKLRRQGWALRVRQHDDGWIQTVKRASEAAGLFDRDEWEHPVHALLPELQAIGETPLKELVGPRQFRHLFPLFRSDVERTTWSIKSRGAEIEATYDEGWIEAGGVQVPINELELELKNGDVRALFAVARQIGRRVPIRLGVAAKSDRGFALAAGKADLPVKAPVHSISRDASVAQAFAAIVADCLKHYRLNEPLLFRERDAEALHQVRVAVRRLRTAMWLFRPAIRDESYPVYDEELRKLIRELGVARNIDVILATMPPGDPARRHLQRNREELYTRIRKMLDGRRIRLFLLDLLAWTHDGEWRQGAKADASLTRFARKRLDKLWQEIDERGSGIATLSVGERHQLRIDAKKMRYALEFLDGLNPAAGDTQRDFIVAAEGIQDSLGHLNDLATRRAILAWPHEESRKEVDRCLRAAKRQLRKMAKIGPFWRTG